MRQKELPLHDPQSCKRQLPFVYRLFTCHLSFLSLDHFLEKVIDAAAADGITLDYTPSPDVDKANVNPEQANEESAGGFVDGIKSGLDKVQNNIDEFNAVMDDAKDKTQQTSDSTKTTHPSEETSSEVKNN